MPLSVTAEYTVNSVLFQLTSLGIETLIAEAKEIKIWVSTNIFEGWKVEAFEEVVKRLHALTRLETLIPRLKIKDVTSIQGNFLHVKGSLREYKIHVGSGNI